MGVRGGALVLVLGVSLGVAGCSAEAEPTPLPPVPSASPSPTPLAVPPEAMAETAEGASAFIRHFLDVMNDAYRTGDARQLRRLSTKNCKSCEAVARDVDRLSKLGHTVDGERYKITFVATAGAVAGEPFLVDFHYDADPYVERTADGAVAQEFPAEPSQVAQALLIRTDGGWRVDAIRLVNG